MGKLWYEQPAVEWEEALPIGNGRMGAMVYGGTDCERIQLNEESMWYGGKVNRINPDFRENLPKVRAYLDAGEISKAERLMDKAMSGCPDSMHPYQVLGDISFYFGGIQRDEVTDYKRTLDLDRAVVTTEFTCRGTVYRREVFATRPGDCIVMRFTAEGEGTVDFTARMRRGKFFDGVGSCGDDGIELYGNLGKGGIDFSMLLRAEVKGSGKVTTLGETLNAEGAKEASFDRQILQRKTGVFLQNFRQNRLDFFGGIFVPRHALGAEVRRLKGQQPPQRLPAVPAQPPAQQLPVRLQGSHVLFHQKHHLLPQSRRCLQPQQNFIGHFGAFCGMAGKMAPAGFIRGKDGRFSHIMEQRRPAQGQIRRHAPHHPGRVGINIVGMVRISLIEAHCRRQLRDCRGDNRREAQKILRRHPDDEFA